jgi:hypothetical protein
MKDLLKSILKVVLGLLLVIIPLYLVFPQMPLENWGKAAIELIKGGITILVFLTGIIFILLGLSELKE